MHNLFKQSVRSTSWAAVCFVLFGTSILNVNAQETGSLTLEEIIVTARAFEENLQDIPLSISAFDKKALARKSISELDDVARFTPGFSYEDFAGGTATPIIRGQAQTQVTALESNTATFFDGIYIPRAWAIDVGTSNIERIEVVKGPQSARYGRNAFSGAINYAPNKAKLGGELSTDIGITLGVDERRDVNFAVNLPVNEQFAIAASYNYSEFDGSWSNRHPFSNLDTRDARGTSGNVGGWEKNSFAISVAAEPTEALSLELAYYKYDNENEARASRWVDHNVNTDIFNCGGTQFGNSLLICGELPETGDTTLVDPRSYAVHSDTDITRFNVSYTISEAWDVSYLYGKIEGEVETGTSSEPDPTVCGTLLGPPAGFAVLCNFQTTPIGGIDYDTHELRFNYDSGSIRGAFGVFFSEGVDDNDFSSFNIAPILDPDNFVPLVGQIRNTPSFIPDPGPFNVNLRDEITSTDVSSLFGELHWTSDDEKTRLGIEVRYSKTDVDLQDLRGGSNFSEEYTSVDPRFTIERDLSDESLVFLTLASGSKTGGFNPSAVAEENQSFDEEKNWTVEIGSKNTLMDGRLNLNAAVFYIDWTDIQINSSDPDAVDPLSTNIVLNLGDADVYGLEFDTVFQASENITLEGTLSFVDATYKDGTIDQRFARPAFAPPGLEFLAGPPCDNVVCNSSGEVGGNEVERTPTTQISLGAQWQDESSIGDYYLRADLTWQNEYFATPANLATIPSRTLLNLRTGLDIESGLSLSVWVKNALDEEYVSNSFVVISPFNNQYGTFFGERRTLGLTAEYSF